MLYIYMGFAGAGLIASVYLAIMLDKYKNKCREYECKNRYLAVVKLDMNEFEFNVGDEFYYANITSSGNIVSEKRTCCGVVVKAGTLYLLYRIGSGLYSEYEKHYDICGKTAEEAIEKMRKKIYCKNSEVK